MTHPLLSPNHVAVITGGASGIGLAAAHRFAGLGMRVCIVDRDRERLAAARAELEGLAGAEAVMTSDTDVSSRVAVEALANEVFSRWGAVHVLLDNAAIQPGSAVFGAASTWEAILSINLGGIIHVGQVFGERMADSGEPGLIVVTGSKQGITTPPGDPAYNVAKAGVKAFAEALQHELRNREGGRVEARLLIPGFVFTNLTKGERVEKPAGAWTAEELVDFLMDKLETDDFYILCPDNDVDRKTDEKRIAWAAGDIIENRPPLSRWHPAWADKFKTWMARS
ncbi:SDR family NAD(P)-dependent oxidoreductase [Mangrovicella endophytica]|uniref:SDR family NAD(P)-dependent oxidoreductase n=1 Tax=Mangrovicella endophytica TaxID=2066697 RepID=UPI000C9E7262|nr:SDR family NAD(P)-dependent oxidoreductase [Mangrovicella endophytica]